MRCNYFALLLAGSILNALSPFWAAAAEIRSGDRVEIKADETISDDLYVFGQNISINGTVEGDVVAFGQQITIGGVVHGKVMAAGQTVELTGACDGARLAGQIIRISPKAKLDGDLMAAGFSLECAKDSDISGDVFAAGFQSLLAGQVGGDVHGGLANCRLEGTFKGDVDLEVGGGKSDSPPPMYGPQPPLPMPGVPGGLTISDSAILEGDLKYQSPQEARIDKNAKIVGEVTYRAPSPSANGAPAAVAKPTFLAVALRRARHVFCVGLVGVAVLLLFPRWSQSWADTIRTRPAASFLGGAIGFVGFIALLVVALVIVIAVPILLGVVRLGELVPIVLVGGIAGYLALIVGFWLVAMFLAEALAGFAIGRLALKDTSLATRLGAMVLGLAVVALLLSIPYVGWWLGLLVMLSGIGAVCLWVVGFASTKPIVQAAATQPFGPLPPVKPIPIRSPVA